MNNTCDHNSKLSASLQEDLAAYGIMRSDAIKKSHGEYFGLHQDYNGYEASYDKTLEKLNLDDGKYLAILAPENVPFNLLAPKDLQKDISTANPTKVRQFLRNLLDSI